MHRLKIRQKPARDCFARLALRYAEPHRHYRTLSRVLHCLEQLSPHSESANNLDALVMAIIYQDAVCDTTAFQGNEEKSAKYWLFDAEQVLEIGDKKFVKEVARLIRLTAHHQVDASLDSDGALFLDVCWAILAEDAEVYDSYADRLRLEYPRLKTFDDWAFARVVIFIDPLLCQDRIFHSRHFGDREEQRAKANLMEERFRYQHLLPIP